MTTKKIFAFGKPSVNNYPKLIITFHLDSNCINARGLLPEINELEKWEKLGVIEIERPYAIEEELYNDAPNGMRFKKAISSGYLWAKASITTTDEHHQLHAIENIVFPGGASKQGEINDLYGLFTARKYYAVFITNDGAGGKARGILTRKIELEKIGVVAMSSKEALAFLYKRLSELTYRERKLSKDLGEDEPAWVAEWISEKAKFESNKTIISL